MSADGEGTMAPRIVVRRAPIVVRAARAGDIPALVAILHATFESTWRPQITRRAAEAFLAEDRPAVFVAEQGLACFVAELESETVGLVHFEGDFVHALHVHPGAARRGIGSALMDVAEAEIGRAGHTAVRLETDTFNAPARAFYDARGFEERDRYPDEEWKSGLTTLLLVKRL
ncbi:MAG: GNAT family N-acetyltransferase [Caulobacteraceae bacterium]